jgi:hypothetical protein
MSHSLVSYLRTLGYDGPQLLREWSMEGFTSFRSPRRVSKQGVMVRWNPEWAPCWNLQRRGGAVARQGAR